MAVLHYHMHYARPDGFANGKTHVIRLILLPEVTGKHGVWLYRHGEWTHGRFHREDGPLSSGYDPTPSSC